MTIAFHKTVKNMGMDTLKECIGKHEIGAIAIFMLASFICVFATNTELMKVTIVKIVIGMICYGFCCDLVIRRHLLKKELKKRCSKDVPQQ